VGVSFWFWSQYGNNPYPNYSIQYGTTFSSKYAKELGLDWQAAYIATLDDLGVKHLRIPIYWDEVETEPGVYILTHVEWMLNEAAGRGADVTLVVGNRVPRWPECHPPIWTINLSESEVNQAEARLVREVVTTFKGHPALKRWQVENEPFLSVFGECEPPNDTHIAAMSQLVHDLDQQHEIMITDSGELSSWTKAASGADVLGISMYRVTWNSFWGYFYYPIPPVHYSAKAKLVEPLVNKVIVSELQVEPWPPGLLTATPLAEQFKSMNQERINANIDFARRTGFSEVYLWGTEWWYWLKTEQNSPDIWNNGRQIFESSR